MKHAFLLGALLILGTTLTAQKSLKPDVPTDGSSKILYNDNMQEVKGKTAPNYLLIKLDENGLPVGKASLYRTKENLLVWEGEYFLFNRIEPSKSKYQGLCTWYYPNKQKMRVSQFRDGLLDGKTVLYDEKGNTTYSGVYKDGKLQGGLMAQYDESGVSGKAYYQVFENLYSGWEESTKDGEAFVDRGALIVQAKTKDGYAKRETLPIDAARDFSIETAFDLRGPEAMILYGQKDLDNYYGIAVSGKGTIRLEHVSGGKEQGNGQVYKVALNRNENILKIMKMGDDVFISMNGNMVTSYKFTRFYGSQFGFFLPAKSGGIAVFSIIARELAKGKTRTETASQATEAPVEKETEAVAGWKPAAAGFYISPNGLLVTSYSAVENARKIGITQVRNGAKVILDAKVIVKDVQNDLAILQVDDARFVSPGAVPYVISSRAAEVGLPVFSVGYGSNDEVVAQDAAIKSRSGAEGDTRVYGVTGLKGDGIAGSPLIDKNGNLVGVYSSLISGNGAGDTYSVKSTFIMNLLDAMDAPPKLPVSSLLRGKPQKEQLRILRSFVPQVVIE